MKLEPIVVSLPDTDLYKFNMDQVIFHKPRRPNYCSVFCVFA